MSISPPFQQNRTGLNIGSFAEDPNKAKDETSALSCSTSSNNTTTSVSGRAITKSNKATVDNLTGPEKKLLHSLPLQGRPHHRAPQHNNPTQLNGQPNGTVWTRSLSHPTAQYYPSGPSSALRYPPGLGGLSPAQYTSSPQPQFVTSPQPQFTTAPQPQTFLSFEEPAYTPQSKHGSSETKRTSQRNPIRFIRPALSPPTDHPEFSFSAPHVASTTLDQVPSSTASVSTSANELASEIVNSLNVASPIISSPQSIWANSASNMQTVDLDDSDSDEEDSLTHPNKFPVEIEYHDNKFCLYKRQPTRSGLKVKQTKSAVYDPLTSETRNQMQQIKYYQKDLVRICRCGNYNQMDGALVHGRANDCDGYEIHYSQKCKWKAYDDFKTGKRVLIRLCKCYKPMA